MTKVSNLRKRSFDWKLSWYVFAFASTMVDSTLLTLLTMRSSGCPWCMASSNIAKPQILELTVSVEGPSEFQGNIIGTINQRRGMITGTTEEDGYVTLDAEVPLSECLVTLQPCVLTLKVKQSSQ